MFGGGFSGGPGWGGPGFGGHGWGGPGFGDPDSADPASAAVPDLVDTVSVAMVGADTADTVSVGPASG
jgi:hypothetical protein